MSERRNVFFLFVGLMLCISLWRISLQDMHAGYNDFDDSETLSTPINITKSNTASPKAAAAAAAAVTTPTPAPYLDMLTKYDENMLIDLHNFNYIINQAGCDEKITNQNAFHDDDQSTSTNDLNAIEAVAPIALILVHSAPQNADKRNTIRETWGRKDPRARIFFLLGAVNTTALQSQLRQENEMFQDIIQGNFFDTYRNMTYKHTMALKWFVYNCPKLKYLIKSDDDVFVNTPVLYEFLEQDSARDRNFLFCRLQDRSPIARTWRSKWRVSTREFSGSYYPPYCPGFVIIYSNDVVWQLYREAQRTPYFWIDDVHITGTLAKQSNISITDFRNYYIKGTKLDGLIDGSIQLSDINPQFITAEPNLPQPTIRSLWHLVETAQRR